MPAPIGRKCYVPCFWVPHTAIHAKKIASPERVPTGKTEMGSIELRRTSGFLGRGPGTWPKAIQGAGPSMARFRAGPAAFFWPIAISVIGGVYSAWVKRSHAIQLPFYLSLHSCGCRSPPLETPTARRLVFVRMAIFRPVRTRRRQTIAAVSHMQIVM